MKNGWTIFTNDMEYELMTGLRDIVALGFALFLSYTSLAGSTTMPSSMPSCPSPEAIIRELADGIAVKVKLPMPPVKPDTKGMTQVQAEDARKKYDEASKEYLGKRDEVPNRLAAQLQAQQADRRTQQVEWTLQVKDVVKERVGFTVVMTSDSGIIVKSTLSPKSEKEAQALRLGQFVTLNGAVGEAAFASVIAKGLEIKQEDLSAFVSDRLFIQVKPVEIEPLKTIAIGIVLCNRLSMASVSGQATAMARATIQELPEQAQFVFLTGPFQPKGMIRTKLFPATKENKQKADELSKGLPGTAGGGILQPIKDAYRLLSAASYTGKKVLFVYADGLDTSEAKKLEQFLEDASGKVTVCLWLWEHAAKIAPKLLDQMKEKGLIIREY